MGNNQGSHKKTPQAPNSRSDQTGVSYPANQPKANLPYAPKIEELGDWTAKPIGNAGVSPYLEKLRLRLTGPMTAPKIDETKTLLFKQGHSPVYSDSILMYVKHASGKPVFCDVMDPKNYCTRDLHFSENLSTMIYKSSKDLQRIGWIVVYGHKWGFLLDLDSLEPIYNAKVPKHWKNLVKHDFFIEEFIKYAHYNYDKLEGNEMNIIPSTEFDAEVRPCFCPIYDRLFYHQKRETGWMFQLENDHDLQIPLHMQSIPFLDTGFSINNTTREIGIGDGKVKKTPVPSGILASQIGSGKTVSMIALMSIGSQFIRKWKKKEAQNAPQGQIEESKLDAKAIGKKDEDITEEEEEKLEDMVEDKNLDELKVILNDAYEASLIIVTKNILHQWKAELEKFAPFLRVFLWENTKDIATLKFSKAKGKDKINWIKDYDVILTHRKVIEEASESLKRAHPQLWRVKFRRIIIDEIHELVVDWDNQIKKKGQDSKVTERIDMAKFYNCLTSLQRHYTWGITGTPNNLNFYNNTELLFKLLNLQNQFTQLNVYKEFKTRFLQSHVRANASSVNLPPLTKSFVQAQFNQLQNFMYQAKLGYSASEEEARIACSQLLPQYDIPEMGNLDSSIQKAIGMIHEKHQKEIEQVMKNLAKDPNDKVLKQRLKALEDENNFYLEMISILQQNMVSCPICLCDVEVSETVVTNCVHSICVKCYAGLMKSFAPICPICRNQINDNQLIIHPNFQKNKITKLKSILDEINKVPEDEKIIIFTQFHSLVNKLGQVFKELKINYMVLKGKPSEINISLRKFEEIPEIKVLLISVEQAASGINITAANHVFFAHPIFGVDVEKAALTYNQCIGRAYRIGQTKPVDVKLFVTHKSMEEKMTSIFMDSQKNIF